MPPPRTDVSAERRTQIIEAAMACFTRKGYTNTTMDDIVAESGLSKGAIYWYFHSKDDLFTTAMTSLFEDWGQEAIAALVQHETTSEKLRAGGRVMAGFCCKAQGLFGLFLEFWAQSDRREKVGQFWADVLIQYEKVIAAAIDEGVQNGEFKPVDAENLVWAIMAAYDGLAAYVMLIPGLDLERVSEVFVETLLGGLVADEHGSGRHEE